MNGGFMMDISAVSSLNTGGNYTQSKNSDVSESNQGQLKIQKENTVKDTKEESERKSNINQEMSHEEVRNVSAEMNKFMRMLNSNIRFVVHEKTNTRMVQVVDNKDNTVLKEFPSHELLDIKAKIREYVGILLDKHI